MGTRLRELRGRAGLTQENLARAIDVTVGAVRKWEAGQSTPSLERAVRLAAALGVTVDELAGVGGPGRKRGGAR
jgi:transcriptional regulator with XRE-family HTH domain